MMWIRANADKSLDSELEDAVRTWLESDAWPGLGAIVYPGRDASIGKPEAADRGACWDFFEKLPLSEERHARVAADASTFMMHRALASGLMP